MLQRNIVLVIRSFHPQIARRSRQPACRGLIVVFVRCR